MNTDDLTMSDALEAKKASGEIGGGDYQRIRENTMRLFTILEQFKPDKETLRNAIARDVDWQAICYGNELSASLIQERCDAFLPDAIANGLDPFQTDKNGHNLFHVAASVHNTEACRYLRTLGMNLDHSVLMQACQRDFIITRTLCRWGAYTGCSEDETLVANDTMAFEVIETLENRGSWGKNEWEKWVKEPGRLTLKPNGELIAIANYGKLGAYFAHSFFDESPQQAIEDIDALPWLHGQTEHVRAIRATQLPQSPDTHIHAAELVAASAPERQAQR